MRRNSLSLKDRELVNAGKTMGSITVCASQYEVPTSSMFIFYITLNVNLYCA